MIKDTDDLTEAQGLRFLCPKCDPAHYILVWFKDKLVPTNEEPNGRWTATGTGYLDLTLTPSINILSCWHGFITNGSTC
jgi:hypothetical protein